MIKSQAVEQIVNIDVMNDLEQAAGAHNARRLGSRDRCNLSLR